MHCRYPIHALDHRHFGTAPEFCDREIRELWRELVSFPDRLTLEGRLLRVRSGHAEVEVQ